MGFENLIIHPKLIYRSIDENTFFDKLNFALKKAQRIKCRIWILGGSLIELKSKNSHKIKELLKKANVLAFLEKDLETFLEKGWEGCLELSLKRLKNSAVLVDSSENFPYKHLTLDEFLKSKEDQKIEFIDLKSQQDRIRKHIEHNIFKTLYNCKFILGEEIDILEKSLAEFVGVKHCITLSSGTDALLAALMAYEVKKGDAVITTPFTFIATAETIALLGATPVFVDIEEETFNIDPAHLERAIETFVSKNKEYPLPKDYENLSLKGIIAVNLFGHPADYDRINKIAKKYDLFVIEDAAQSFGATYKGKKSCSLADIGCTSFFPAKPLGIYGDGGAVFLDDDELADKIRSIRVHGSSKENRYEHIRVGINGRFDTIQAGILIEKLKIFHEELVLREKAASYYTQNIIKKTDFITHPKVKKDVSSSWAQYSIVFRSSELKKMAIKSLEKNKIPYSIYYPVPLHLQPVFKYLGYKKGDFPVSESISERILSLPFYPYISKEEQDKVLKALLENV